LYESSKGSGQTYGPDWDEGEVSILYHLQIWFFFCKRRIPEPVVFFKFGEGSTNLYNILHYIQVIGCLLDFYDYSIWFTINGSLLEKAVTLSEPAKHLVHILYPTVATRSSGSSKTYINSIRVLDLIQVYSYQV